MEYRRPVLLAAAAAGVGGREGGREKLYSSRSVARIHPLSLEIAFKWEPPEYIDVTCLPGTKTLINKQKNSIEVICMLYIMQSMLVK